MRKQIIAALLCVPCAANAEKLLVEYQGTVSSVAQGTDAAPLPYAVGDSIGGRLTIDASLAPRDTLLADATIGRYSGGIDFILGPSRPIEVGQSNSDLLLVYDDWTSATTGAGPQDGFLIHDRSIGIDGEFNLVLGMLRP
ncbi:MAG TPA: hypothetical protein VM692_02095, partial [Gammaproteobacteria bacterium]|nr:hypothetical protein [Gammaproteobacteria bacterium]